MIADHDRDRRSRDFQNMIVSDRRSWFGKVIVSDRRSRKKVSCLTLQVADFNSMQVCNYGIIMKTKWPNLYLLPFFPRTRWKLVV